MNIVPAVATPLGFAGVADAFRQAYLGMTGEALPRTLGESLLVLSAVETGRWKSLKNYNFGNISAGSKYEGNAWRPPWFSVDESSSDRMRELHAAMLANRAPSAFRAYATPAGGAFDYLAFLHNRPGAGAGADYAPVLAAMRLGADRDIVDALHDTGYSKDYGPAHYPTFESLRREIHAMDLFPQGGGEPPGDGSRGGLELLPLVILFAGIGAALYMTQRQPEVSVRWREGEAAV